MGGFCLAYKPPYRAGAGLGPSPGFFEEGVHTEKFPDIVVLCFTKYNLNVKKTNFQDSARRSALRKFRFGIF